MADPDALDPSASDPAAQDSSGPAPPSPWAAVDLNNPGWGDDSIANKPVQFWGLDGLSPDLEKNLYNAMTAHSLGHDPSTVDPGARPFMNLMGLMSSAHAELGPGVFGDDLGGLNTQAAAQPASAPPANPQPAEPALDIAPQQPVTPPDLSTAIPDTSVQPGGSQGGPQGLMDVDGLPLERGQNAVPRFDGLIANKVTDFFNSMRDKNIPAELRSGLRTEAGQKAVQGNKNGGARAGRSLHQAGLAFDINWEKLTPSQQATARSTAAGLGFKWGGAFRNNYDAEHFYVDPFPTIEARQAYIGSLQQGGSR